MRRLITERDANPNIADKFDYTPLHNAIMWGSEDIVMMLLKHGSRVNVFNVFGYTPLYMAANEVPNMNIVKILLRHNADVNLYNSTKTNDVLLGKYWPKGGAAGQLHKTALLMRSYVFCDQLRKYKSVIVIKRPPTNFTLGPAFYRASPGGVLEQNHCKKNSPVGLDMHRTYITT